MTPSAIKLHRKSKTLEIHFGDGAQFTLAAEYLRVYSPSAEVRGHGVGNEVLQVGKINVGIESIETAGNYALKIVFDDGHDTGLYGWGYLRELGENYATMWQDYLDRMNAAGENRDPDVSVVKLI
jgi:DUF971 family protein